MDLDGVGGVSILAKAKIFRAGVHFPAFSFEKHAETEGFGKVCFVILPLLSAEDLKGNLKHTTLSWFCFFPEANKTQPQMARRMQYSVVGLPHYTIWHLYEPSADDLRHMEDMEKERLQREADDKEKQEREKKISAEFDTGMKDEWEADKRVVEESLKKEPGKESEVRATEGGEKAIDRARKEKLAAAKEREDMAYEEPDHSVVIHAE